jgi:short-subunit dehydrogenase
MRTIKPYTLITGASDGFGKALAIECASRKMNLALVALPGPELYNLACFIRRNFFVDVRVFEKDLTKESSCYELLHEIMGEKIDVNILINNAGIGSTEFFTNMSPEFFKKQIQLNVMATALVTSLFIPELKKNAPAHILNVGSLCSFFDMPQKQVYGGTKSFVYFFSRSLRLELQVDKIDVSVVCPGGMNTNIQVSFMNKTGNYLSRLSVMNPEEVAEQVIGKMLAGKKLIIPGKLNKFFLVLHKILPGFLKTHLIRRSMNRFKPATMAPGISNNSSPLAA